jgi:pyruvate/2-oxoglutarate dehydrogenase complex dihydrolipoamide dehydrogenase (E3) component
VSDTYDLVVIGGGATGLGAARQARKDGRRVALVEVEAEPGGDCTHYGCVPSKALLESARRVHAARTGPAYGFRAEPVVDFPAVMDRVKAVIADVSRDESPALLAREGIELVTGWGRFTSPTTVQVGERVLTTKRVVLASGSKALVPPVEGLAEVGALDNTTVFDLRVQPRHLLVLGGGPIGVELAQAFRRLGSQVTVVEGMPTVLGREEPQVAKVLTRALTAEGVTVRTGAKVERASRGRPGPRAVTLHLSDGTTVSGSHLLVAVGRTPRTDGMDLERAGVRLDGRRVVTDARLRAARTVWAAGDCTSRLQFTHVGDEQGRLAARNAFARPWQRGGARWDDRVVPWVTFTEPEVAHVGLTEAQAYARYGERAVVSTSRDTRGDRARTAGETGGFTTLIAVPGRVGGMVTGRLVGMTVVSPMAGEVIAEGALAMRSGARVGRIAQTIHAYPTWSLSTRMAAARFFGEYGGMGSRPARPPRPDA